MDQIGESPWLHWWFVRTRGQHVELINWCRARLSNIKYLGSFIVEQLEKDCRQILIQDAQQELDRRMLLLSELSGRWDVRDAALRSQLAYESNRTNFRPFHHLRILQVGTPAYEFYYRLGEGCITLRRDIMQPKISS